jgi:biopolymer transport protein ExbD
VIVKGDKETDFGNISDVMDALQKANANRFNLMTELKTERK